MMTMVAVLFSVALSAMRLAGHKGQVFQAIAHLWVGGLVGYAIPTHHAESIALAITMSAVETYAFIRDRFA